MIVGVDFGTTNSILAYIENGTPREFRYGITESTIYTPSAVLYDGLDCIIGQPAIKELEDEEDVEIYRFFKTALPSVESSRVHEKNAYRFTLDFLRKLLIEGELSFQRRKGLISKLVVSVPQTWHAQVVNRGAENLEKIILEELGLPLVQLISEPQAALAYYLKKNKVGKNTNILVCDIGGGTFDFSLCTVKGHAIQTVDFQGSQLNGIGKAGVFYTAEILSNAYKESGLTPDWESLEFKRRLWILDRKMISAKMSKKILYYYQQLKEQPELKDKPLIKIDHSISISIDNILTSFQKVEETLIELLEKIDQKIQDLRLSLDKILLVGGFSQNFMVRNTIYHYFGIDEHSPKAQALSQEDALFAIANGAALIAANKIEIKEFYPHTVSLIGKRNRLNPTSQNIEKIEDELIIIHSGESFKFNQPIFARESISIKQGTFSLKGKIYVKGDKMVWKDFARDIDLPIGNRDDDFRVGLIINSSSIARFVIEDIKRKKIYYHDLGSILDD